MNRLTAPVILVLMGVSGCGKSTIGDLLAAKLGWPMIEGDEFHPPENIAKMRAAVPLTDADRWPWLAAIADRLDTWCVAGTSGIITCSALKRVYRDRLGSGRPGLLFVYLKAAPDIVRPRLVGRLGHFMPVGLLDSQYQALEEPAADEPVMTVAADRPPAEIVADIIRRLPQH
jgi:gluconokinase